MRVRRFEYQIRVAFPNWDMRHILMVRVNTLFLSTRLLVLRCEERPDFYFIILLRRV